MNPEKKQFFSPRDFHNTAKLHLIWEQELPSGREEGAAWGSQFPGATQLHRYSFHELARLTGIQQQTGCAGQFA